MKNRFEWFNNDNKQTKKKKKNGFNDDHQKKNPSLTCIYGMRRK